MPTCPVFAGPVTIVLNYGESVVGVLPKLWEPQAPEPSLVKELLLEIAPFTSGAIECFSLINFDHKHPITTGII